MFEYSKIIPIFVYEYFAFFPEYATFAIKQLGIADGHK